MAPVQTESVQKAVTGASGYNYLLYLPAGYEERDSWPLVLFLHGAGERGSNLESVKTHGIPRVVEERRDFPFIAVSPQCPSGSYWKVSLLDLLLKEIEASYRVDPDRIYLTGISMGGYGTWAMALAHPAKFAAIAPICGGGDPDRVCGIKDLPVWVFHGARDRVVPISESERMVDALKRCGGNVRFTVYPQAEHDSWTETYNKPALYDWILAQRRQSMPD